MPITAFICPECKRTVPLDHFQDGPCSLTIHPDYANAILHRNDDRYVQSKEVTVTAGLGCPRSRAIEQAEDVAVNPLDYNALLIGSAWDLHMAAFSPREPGWAKVQLKGVLAGIEVFGEIDRIRRITYKDGSIKLIIEDHKHSNNFQYKYKRDEPVNQEYRIQTSLYAELYEQQFCERPVLGVIWYHFSGANNSSNPPLLPKAYEFLGLQECLNHHPYGGEFTVLELYQQAAQYRDGRAPLDLPLAGLPMKFGKADFCDYCQVRAVCMTAARGAPF